MQYWNTIKFQLSSKIWKYPFQNSFEILTNAVFRRIKISFKHEDNFKKIKEIWIKKLLITAIYFDMFIWKNVKILIVINDYF